MSPIVVGGPTPALPLTPTPIAPGSGAYVDVSNDVDFAWQYNPGVAGNTQTDWALAVFTDGALLARFYDAGTDTFGVAGGAAVWNAGTTTLVNQAFTATIAGGALVNGHQYQWAVATKDASGGGPFSGLILFTGQQSPTVAVLEPTGDTPSASPQILWSAGIPTGSSQLTYRVIVYDETQYMAADFLPGTSAGVYDSGVVGSSSVASIFLSLIPVYLPNAVNYRAYVQIAITGGQVSTWAYSAFTTDYPVPVTPTIVAAAESDPDTGYPLIKLTVTGADNMLAMDDADPTLGLGNWEAVSGCTVSSDPTLGLLLTHTSGDMVADTEYTVSGLYPIGALTELTAFGTFLSASTARSCTIAMKFYDPTTFSLLATHTSGAVMDGTAAQAHITATSPNQRALLSIEVTVASPAEDHSCTEFGVYLGASVPSWSPGGFYGVTQVSILRSDGVYVRNASLLNPALLEANWTIAKSFLQPAVGQSATVTFAGPGDIHRDFRVGELIVSATGGTYQVVSIPSLPNTTVAVVMNTGYATNAPQGTTILPGTPVSVANDTDAPNFCVVNDYEAVQTDEYTYQAVLTVDLNQNTVASAPATSNAQTISTDLSGYVPLWWEIDPVTPSSAVAAQVINWQPQVTEQSTAHLVTGQGVPNIVASNMGGLDGAATFETFDPTTYGLLENLLQSGTTIFVSSPWGDVDTGYARFGPQSGGMSTGTGNKVKDSTLLPSTFAGMHRTVAVTWVAQNRPPV